MQIVSVVIARPVDDCWRAFVDPAQMTSWVPGLVDSRVIDARDDGLPAEIQFEFGAALIYSLLYTYDLDEHIVRWEPRPGEHGAVRGFARFTATHDHDGCELTYALEHDKDRKAAERMLDAPKTLLTAFARWMEDR
jgi:uncharacterized protein YndB with AHSA1/START domain